MAFEVEFSQNTLVAEDANGNYLDGRIDEIRISVAARMAVLVAAGATPAT